MSSVCVVEQKRLWECSDNMNLSLSILCDPDHKPRMLGRPFARVFGL